MKRTLVSLVTGFLLLATTPALASPIYTDALGQGWRDMTDTEGLTWSALDAVCPNDGSTACAGMAGVVDVTGWTWATREQVRDLFRELTGLTTELDDFQHFEFNSLWAPQALALFPGAGGRTDVLTGWSASLATTDAAYRPTIVDLSLAFDTANLVVTDAVGFSSVGLGAFLFQPAVQAAAVPEPTSLSLLAAGLLVAGLIRHRRQR